VNSQYLVGKNSSGFFKGSSGGGVNNGSLNGSITFDPNTMSSGGSSHQHIKRGNSVLTFSKDSPNNGNNN
jgi:hypothetical protein